MRLVRSELEHYRHQLMKSVDPISPLVFAIVPSVPFNYRHCLDRCKQLPMKMMKYNLVALPPLKQFQLTLYLITCSLYVNVRENDGYILFIHLC